MKTLIAIPSMDMCPVEFASSLARLNKVGETGLQINKGSLVYEARNNLAVDAIRKGTDFVLWFDSDMVFPPNVMETMMRHMEDGHDIVTGIYFRRTGDFKPVIFKSLEFDCDGKCLFEDYNDFPTDGLFQVAACGFGCIMMRTSVLMDVLAKYSTAFTPIGNTGEDIAFCWRARQLGYKIMCDPSIPLGHVGYHVVTKEFYNAYRANTNGNGN